MSSRPIYMDHHATCPVDEDVLQAMLPYFRERFGNAASKSHRFGWEADEAVARARQSVAKLIGAEAKEIVFTSGATEANNLALKGALQARGLAEAPKPLSSLHAVSTAIEHKAVLDPLRALERDGLRLTIVSPDAGGRVSAAAIESALTPDTRLVSVMHVNNEIGTVQPIAEIGALCRERGVLFHTDATQGVALYDVDVEAMHVDLLSLSAHKLYGPKGVGALFVRRRPRVHLAALLDGGGHERGRRSGTIDVPGVVGLGAAADLAVKGRAAARELLAGLRERLLAGLKARVPDLVVHGDLTARHPGNLNLAFPGAEAEALLLRLSAVVALSTGSACTSAALAPSHVLTAIGVGSDLAHCSVRFGLGLQNTAAEVDRVVEAVADAVDALRTAAD